MFGTQDDRRVLRGAHRRRRRVRQRRAEGAARRRAASTASFVARAHRRASTSCVAELERRVVRRPRAAVGRDRAPTWSASPRMYAAADSAVLVWSMGITQHAHGVDNVRGDRQPRRSPAATSAGRAPASCRSAATPACRAAPRWAPTRPRFPAASPIDAGDRGRARRAVGLRGAATQPGLTAAEMVEAAPARRARRAVTRAAATSSTCCPTPSGRASALGARAAARPPGHRASRTRCSSTRRDRRAAARRDPLRAARRRHRDHHRAADRLQPRDPGPTVGEARSEWEIFADLGRARRPGARRTSSAFDVRPGDPRRDRAGRARCTPASRRSRKTGDAVQWGGARLCDGGDFPTPDGQAHFAVVAPRRAVDPRGPLRCCRTRRGKQFNSMVLPRPRLR